VNRILTLIVIILIVLGCDIKPSKINYGSDACHFCKMSIVDTQHASQIVTVKGKAFKYDAIECMLNDMRDWKEADPKLLLVANYNSPKSLIDATKAFYLITPSIPSPMGEFLSAFDDPVSRDEILKTNEGMAMNWDELKQAFSSN